MKRNKLIESEIIWNQSYLIEITIIVVSLCDLWMGGFISVFEMISSLKLMSPGLFIKLQGSWVKAVNRIYFAILKLQGI